MFGLIGYRREDGKSSPVVCTLYCTSALLRSALTMPFSELFLDGSRLR